MATRRISILKGAIPDDSGEVFWEPLSLNDAGTVIDAPVLSFNDSGTDDHASGSFRVPEDYAGSAVVQVVWSSSATANNARFGFSYLARSGTEDFGAAADESDEVTSAAKSSTAYGREETEFSVLTAGNFVAGDEVIYEIQRHGTDAADDLAAKLYIIGLYFEYSDT